MIRRLSTFLAIVVVLAACNGDSGATTTTTSRAQSTTTVEMPEATTTTVDPTTTTVAAAPPITEPDLSGLEGLSDEVREQLETLIVQAQEIRGLPFLSPPNIRVVTEEELEEMIRADISEQSEDFPADEALYKMLGLLAEGADFEQIFLDVYGEQAGGVYYGETGEIVVRARESLNIVQQGTMIHELVHALTDQHFSFHETLQSMVDEDRLDEASAYLALMEGDATYAEVLWIQTLSQEQLGEFIALAMEIDTTVLDSAPRFLAESLLFPYDTGLAFVQSLYTSAGGWSDVNEAYGALPDLPASTEQVITPEDYRRDLPVEVAVPDINVPGYELERTSVWGEHGFRLLLNQGSGPETVAEAADGWGGDSYQQWFDGENAVLLIVYEGDTADDLQELEAALLSFAMNDFPEDHFAWVDQLDGRLYFIAANETSVGEQIRSDVGLPEPTG
ncbi:MAG TPA: hypothetical protein VMM14_05720 [Acidimicrobiia bacterium]|nr:hypothetical protein [Acidimicrobiia bacterium]